MYWMKKLIFFKTRYNHLKHIFFGIVEVILLFNRSVCYLISFARIINCSTCTCRKSKQTKKKTKFLAII